MAGSRTRCDAGPRSLVSPSALRRLKESSAAIGENCKRLADSLQAGSVAQQKIRKALSENRKLRDTLRSVRQRAKETREASEQRMQPGPKSDASLGQPARNLVLIKGQGGSGPEPSATALSVTAHEINNPLEAITSLLYLLDIGGSIPEPGRQYLDLIRQEVARIGEITRTALGKHRDAGIAEGVDLGELIDNVLDLYRLRFESRGISISREYKVRGRIAAHPRQMREVFANLFLNAIDAMGDGGRLRIRTSAGREWGDGQRPGVRIMVADNGHGIQAQHEKRIFERFFTTKGERGSGIGLSVVHEIIRNHGGMICFRSSTRPHHSGTVFSIFLPSEACRGHRVPA